MTCSGSGLNSSKKSSFQVSMTHSLLAGSFVKSSTRLQLRIERDRMSQKKKATRKAFRDAVFTRDEYKCVICGHDVAEDLDAHHITDRNEIPNGGYVVENGITLCNINCHQIAEEFHSTGIASPGFSPEDLYGLIDSSKEEAVEASKRLG